MKMKNLTVNEILKATDGTLLSGNINCVCENFSRDTRTIKTGDTYIGIKGEKFDGNTLWKEAIKKGAKCVIISGIEINKKELENYKNVSIVLVDDSLKALAKIATLKRSLYDIPVIGITGSVGKTSTKDIVANVISQKYKTLKTVGNNNNHIGLPLTVLRLKDEEVMVVEMGMNHFGEIRLLTNIAKPNICVITNIGTSHIGNLGSRENILKAKLEILEGSNNPTVIINNDNDLLHKWYEENKNNYKIYTYGIKTKSDVMAKNIILNEDSSEFDYENVHINVPVGGEHFILNSLCAIAVGKILNIELNKISEGIASFELTKNRMDITEKNGIKIINDAYNASLESIKASLKYLSNLNNKRKIAVLGDILEAGDYAEDIHKKVGNEVVKNKIDILICSGKNAKYIASQAEIDGMNKDKIWYLKDNKAVADKIKAIAKPGDVVLIKASNGLKFYEIPQML